MPATKLGSLISDLRRLQLLEEDQLTELERLSTSDATSEDLARTLRDRGWMTPFQVSQVLHGRADRLSLGEYVLLEKLGHGGMGDVYKARHRRMFRIVALKIIRREHVSSQTSLDRFSREIRAAAQLAHPNVVLAYDAGQVGDTHFMVMEFVAGTDLGQLVKERGALPIHWACEFIRQAALGLNHAHERGMVHRDVKPSNLLLTWIEGVSNAAMLGPMSQVGIAPLGGGRQAVIKVLDLGLARLREAENAALLSSVKSIRDLAELTAAENASHTLTRDGQFMGTPDYIAPEQALAAHEADARSDLYSLGCTLYLLLTGRVPFPGAALHEKLIRHQEEAPPSILPFRPEAPPAIDEIVQKLMAKKPEDRYNTCGDLVLALMPYCQTVGYAEFKQAPQNPLADTDVETSTRPPVPSPSVDYLAPSGGSGWVSLGPEPSGTSRSRRSSSEAVDSLPPHTHPEPPSFDRPPTRSEDTAPARPFRKRWSRVVMVGLVVASVGLLTGAAVFTMLIPAPEPNRAQGRPSQGDAPRLGASAGSPTPPTPPPARKEDTPPAKRPSGKYAFLLGPELVMNDLGTGLTKSGAVRVEQKTIANGLRTTLKDLLDRQRWETPKEGRLLAGSSLVLALSCPVHRFKGEAEYYLCPVGADLTQRETLVPLLDLYQLLDECPAEFRLLLLDVARSDKVPDELEPLGSPQSVDTPRGTAVFFSCSAGEAQAAPGKRDEGAFFGAIKEAIARKDTIYDFEEYVQVRVFAETLTKQTPKRRGVAEGTAPLKGWASMTQPLPEGEIKDFQYSQQAPVNAVAFAPDGSRSLSSGENRSNSVQVHDLEQKTHSGTPTFLDPPLREGYFVVRTAIFAPDGKSVLLGTGGEFVGAKPLAVGLPAAGRVHLLPITGGKEVAARPLPPIDAQGEKGQWVLCVAFSPDGSQALAGGAVGDIGLYALNNNPRSLRELVTFSEVRKKRQKRITSVLFAPTANQALYTAEDGTIALWDTKTRTQVRSFTGDAAAKTAVYCAAFAPDGKCLLTGDDDGVLTKWDVETGKVLLSFEPKHGKTVRGVAFSSDGRWAVSGSEDGTVRLWDVETGKEMKRFQGHEGAVNSVAFAPDGRFVLSGGQDQSVRLWALPEAMRR